MAKSSNTEANTKKSGYASIIQTRNQKKTSDQQK